MVVNVTKVRHQLPREGRRPQGGVVVEVDQLPGPAADAAHRVAGADVHHRVDEPAAGGPQAARDGRPLRMTR